MNLTQQYGKNRLRGQQNLFYYAVCQLLLYFYKEFPSKILSVYAVCVVTFERGLVTKYRYKIKIKEITHVFMAIFAN